MPAALHRGQVHLPEGDAAGRHELLAEGTPTCDRVTALPQGRDQVALLVPPQISPSLGSIHSTPLEEMEPETASQRSPGTRRGQLPTGQLQPGGPETRLQLRRIEASGPINPELGAIAPLAKIAGGEGGEAQGGRTAEAPVGDQ